MASLDSIRTTQRPQAKGEAWSAFCNLTEHHKFYRVADEKREAAINKAIRATVHNKAVLHTLLPAGEAGGLPAVGKLRAAAKSGGMSQCPFVDYRERALLSERCQDTGDATLCYRVGELYAKQHIYPGEEHAQAPAYFERACVNGSTEACARRAEWSGGDVKWLERACRRGHKPSCARLAVDKPTAPKAKLLKSSPVDDVVKKVKTLYLPSIVDCFEAYAQHRATTTKGKVAFKFSITEHGVANVHTNAFEESISGCLKRQINRWVFTTAKVNTQYQFCYELEGKSMISRRLPPLRNLLAAPGAQSRHTGPVFGRSRRVRVAKRMPRRKKYATVSIYGGSTLGARTLLSPYQLRSALSRRRFYFARCFERHVMAKRSYTYAAYAYTSIRVSATGRATSAHVDRVTRYYNMKDWQRCIEREIKRTKFPVPKNMTTRKATSAAFRNVRFYYYTSYTRPYRADICDFESF